MKLSVRLTPDQLTEATLAGVHRRLDAITKHRTHAQAGTRPGNVYHWEQHIRSAIAEYAACLAFGYTFSGHVENGIRRLNDAGPLEIRTTMNPDGPLSVKSKDLDHQPVVLTKVKDDRVLLVGWCTAGQVREHGWANEWGGHSIAQHDLLGIEELGIEIHWSDQVREYTCLQTG